MAQIRPPTESPFKKLFWPTIDGAESAHAAGMSGFAASALIAGITGFSAALRFNGASRWSIVDCFLFAIIAWAIKSRMSRIAAICGLTYYLAEKFSSLSPLAIAPVLFFTLFFVHSIRGTFAYHKFSKGGLQ